jgi:nucleotidyltransferase/DNA polymerase involved in DNA repair
MELPNRKQRRLWAKEMGLLKQKQQSTFAQKLEMNRRAADAGKQIHHRNVERNLERAEKSKQSSINDEDISNMLEDGLSQEEILNNIVEKTSDNTKNHPY